MERKNNFRGGNSFNNAGFKPSNGGGRGGNYQGSNNGGYHHGGFNDGNEGGNFRQGPAGGYASSNF